MLHPSTTTLPHLTTSYSKELLNVKRNEDVEQPLQNERMKKYNRARVLMGRKRASEATMNF